MDILTNNDLKRILSNKIVRKEWMDQIFRDVKITNQIVEDLGNKLSDFLVDDLSFKQKLLSVTIGRTDYRKKIIDEFVKEFRD